MTLTYLSTFSGVGGLDLGLDRAGMTCVGQVEIDKHARSVLDRHWPDVPKHDDITTAKEWASDIGLVGRVDVVCGGAPCQDLSVAGKREGFAGERSVLVLHMVALAAHVQADWIIYENVPGLLSSNQGRDLGVLILALADAGFPYIEWRTLDSRYFGVAQRRRRVFLVAGTADPRRAPVLLEREGSAGDSAPSHEAGQEVAGTLGGGSGTRGWACDTDRMTFVPAPEPQEREPRRLERGQHRDRPDSQVEQGLQRPGWRRAPQPRHRPIADVIGTLSGGAHPGGFNGQDAYTGQLVIVSD